ncbi:caspase family protein [Mesorhizobium sp. M0016]|uniref:caspase family protein n=1 Tax=Mesorhizobium sp. M0016 TaxID=2956843 RepID=UPI00333CD462
MFTKRKLFQRGLIVLLLFVTGIHTAAAEDPSIFALLVGINNYAKTDGSAYNASDLKGTANDVALMKDLLTGTYGVPGDTDHFMILLDTQATHAAIRQAFVDQLIDKAKRYPDATFLFYFSGHGSLAVDDNGDEGDGYDETILAQDSRGPGGADIRDDEIEGWLNDLKQYTKNIVLVFDSCHSGTVSKDPAIVARQAPLDARLLKGPAPSPKGGKGATSIADAGRVYSVIAGSLADEVSNEDLVDVEGAQRYDGLLTYYLVQTLERSPRLTYREAVMETERYVQKRAPSQRPQAEGDFDRVVFGGIGTRQMPFIAVTDVKQDSISVAAGQAQGVQPGALLAVYSGKATKLVGEDGKIASAIVTSADLKSSTAQLVKTPTEPVSTLSKVRIVSPYSVEQKLAVAVANPPSTLGVGTAMPIKAALGDQLRDNALIRNEQSENLATVSVAMGCMDKGKLIPMEDKTSLTSDCEKVYYITPRDQVGAMHDYHVSATNDGSAVDGIVDALEKIARQENLRVLANRVSPLAGSLGISLVRVKVKTESGKTTVESEVPVVSSGIEPVRVGEYFRFRIANTGTQDLYFSIIGLGTSGSVSVLGDAASGEKLQAGATISTKPALRAGPPNGLESYVVLATTTPVNVRFLEEPGIIKGKDVGPLGWLLDGLSNPGFKDAAQVPDLDLDSWTTVRMDIEILP